jgi:uncharacterized protein (DUF2384 family)
MKTTATKNGVPPGIPGGRRNRKVNKPSESKGDATARFAAISYDQSKGVDFYVRAISQATPMEMVAMERQGVPIAFLQDLFRRMKLGPARFSEILGVPKAKAEKNGISGYLVTGLSGQKALGMIKLIAIAQNIVQNSTAAGAVDFDAAEWFGQWIDQPQTAIGGRRPSELLDTPTGMSLIARVLGSMESGAYQ